MDYTKYFSDDVPSFLKSPIREIFRVVDLSSIYSFAGGYPDASTFPVDDIKSLSAGVLEKYGTKALQYSATQGIMPLREAIAARYGVSPDNVQITTSSQQGIDVCTRILCNPGDIILTSSPTYLGALQSFRSYRVRVMTFEELASAGDQFGGKMVSEESKESVVQQDTQCCRGTREWAGQQQKQPNMTPGHPTLGGLAAVEPPLPATAGNLPCRPKFCYVIPDFQNPSGETMTLQEREKLVAMAREMDFIIVEDSPYRELRYSGEPVPTIYSLAPERTLHLGSFSKIFAPGFRLGWIIGPPELLEQIYICKQSLDLCPPVYDQHIALEFISSGALDANLQKSIALYKTKRDLMLSLLEKYMPEGVSWTHPEGGLFLFLTLPEHIDTVALYDRALKAGVAYVAGSFFYPDGSHRNTMRLNFSFLDADRIEPGIRLLAQIIG